MCQAEAYTVKPSAASEATFAADYYTSEATPGSSYQGQFCLGTALDLLNRLYNGHVG